MMRSESLDTSTFDRLPEEYGREAHNSEGELWKKKFSIHFPDNFLDVCAEVDDLIASNKEIHPAYWADRFWRYYDTAYGFELDAKTKTIFSAAKEGNYSALREGIHSSEKPLTKLLFTYDREYNYPRTQLLDWIVKKKDQRLYGDLYQLIKPFYLNANGDVDITKVDQMGMTVLHWAICFHQLTEIQPFIKLGADVNKLAGHKGNALFWAAYAGSVAIVPALIACGAAINERTYLRNTALLVAAAHGHTEIVRILIANGAYKKIHTGITQPESWLALHEAAKAGHAETIKAIVEMGEEVDAVDHAKRTALYHAVANGHLEAIEALVERGANINKVSSVNTDRHWAADAVENYGDNTALHIAASYGQAKVVQLLIALGADLNAVTDRGDTPLHRAVYHTKKHVTQMLIAAGANMDAVNERRENILAVAKHEYPGKDKEMLKMLVIARLKKYIQEEKCGYQLPSLMRDTQIKGRHLRHSYTRMGFYFNKTKLQELVAINALIAKIAGDKDVSLDAHHDMLRKGKLGVIYNQLVELAPDWVHPRDGAIMTLLNDFRRLSDRIFSYNYW